MLKEWIESVFTRTRPLYRRLGYVYAAVALQARYARCRKAWQKHIDECHAVILQNLPAGAKTAAVVGSGPLYEIPWRQLLEKCEKLILIDVVHPRAVHRLAKRHSRIKLITADVTGFAEVFGDESAVRDLRFQPPAGLLTEPPDLLVSANLLSQLPLEPFAAAKKKWRWVDKQFFNRLAAKMSADHLAWLKRVRAKVTLVIADMDRAYYSAREEFLEKAPSAGVMREGTLVKEWDWLIAPLGEVSRQYSYRMRVECRRLDD